MHLPQNQKIVFAGIGVITIVLIASAIYFSPFKQWLSSQEPKNSLSEQQASINTKMENLLFKRVDFINKLMSDFQLESVDAQTVFYKDGEVFKEITLSSLLAQSADELARTKTLIENGLYIQTTTGNYIKRSLNSIK